MRNWKTPLIGMLAAGLPMVGCAALAETGTLTLPRSTKTIEEKAFYGDTSLNRVTLPDGITRIEAEAFAKSAVQSINLPDSITYIDDTAFDQ
ncbi:MAG: leucine-rich repeat domain-containing protein, partial [bacterium]